jgi:adenosylhomocysteine nucleosidase
MLGVDQGTGLLTMYESPPIVILTALELQYKAVRDRLSGIREPPPAAGTRFEVGAVPGGEVVLGITGLGTHGTAVLAERAIRVFDPVAVLFVGVAGALRSSVRLGDVVVATRVYAYHGAAARTEGLGSRPRVWETDHGLQQTARRLARRDLPDGDGPLVHFGPVADGEARPDVPVSVPLRRLRQHYDDALAVEIESGGAAEAGHLSAVPVGVIRGISDRADGTRADSDGAGGPPRAARHAAAFALALTGELFAQSPPVGEPPEPERSAPDIRIRTTGGNHGAVAGLLNGGVHNHNARPGRTTGPGREERGRR